MRRPNPPERPRAAAPLRWTRRLLGLLAGLTLLAWLVTTSGLYVWFSVGCSNRVRIEYGRIVWSHGDQGSSGSSAGVDGGARRALWHLEHHQHESGARFVTRIPLWLPFLLLASEACAASLLLRRLTAGR